MQNQCFGDINDYRKYGLLRLLSGHGKIRTPVCWMLTPDDGRTDGSLTDYLHQPEKWRHYDPPLFDHLRGLVLRQALRQMKAARSGAILDDPERYGAVVRTVRSLTVRPTQAHQYMVNVGGGQMLTRGEVRFSVLGQVALISGREVESYRSDDS